jgi:hypothetical protein
MMTVLLFIGVVLCVSAFVALGLWVRRSERDIDYVALEADSTQTDGQRQAKQVAIGLTSSTSSWGL